MTFFRISIIYNGSFVALIELHIVTNIMKESTSFFGRTLPLIIQFVCFNTNYRHIHIQYASLHYIFLTLPQKIGNIQAIM